MWQSIQTLLCPSPPPEQRQAGLPGWCLHDKGCDFCSLMFPALPSVQGDVHSLFLSHVFQAEQPAVSTGKLQGKSYFNT